MITIVNIKKDQNAIMHNFNMDFIPGNIDREFHNHDLHAQLKSLHGTGIINHTRLEYRNHLTNLTISLQTVIKLTCNAVLPLVFTSMSLPVKL